MLCVSCKGKFGRVAELLKHQRTHECSPWAEVVELKEAGKFRAAAHAANMAMGVHVEMTEEEKAERKAYYDENKEVILARAKIKRDAKARLMEGLQASSKTVKRKGY